MRFKVQLVVCAEAGQEEPVQEIVVLDKTCHRIEHLGLTLAEAKQLLTTLQHLLERQAAAFVATQSQCAHCAKPLGIKGYHTRTFRTLCGTSSCI